MLFPPDPEEKSQEEPSGQSRTPVLTVVSKFKVSPVALTQHTQFAHPSPVLAKHLPESVLCWGALVSQADEVPVYGAHSPMWKTEAGH